MSAWNLASAKQIQILIKTGMCGGWWILYYTAQVWNLDSRSYQKSKAWGHMFKSFFYFSNIAEKKELVKTDTYNSKKKRNKRQKCQYFSNQLQLQVSLQIESSKCHLFLKMYYIHCRCLFCGKQSKHIGHVGQS